MSHLIDFILHIDVHLAAIVAKYGVLTYGVLFAIVFAETGLVVAPLLPGDSLLFAAGAIAAIGGLNVVALIIVLFVAAVVGDAVNYWIGKRLGERIIARGSFLGIPVRPQHVSRAQQAFEKYGARAIVFARFMPIVRTFAPFMAGVGGMRYRLFAIYNVVGGAIWVVLFTLAGYYFGNVPVVKHNFTLVIMAIIVLSLVPPVIELLRARHAERTRSVTENSADNMRAE